MSLAEKPLKQLVSFRDLKPGISVWLGTSPDEKRINCELRDWHEGGLTFYVVNGAWNGVLYEEKIHVQGDVYEPHLFIIDERGGRHDRIYIVEVIEREKPAIDPDEQDKEIPF